MSRTAAVLIVLVFLTSILAIPVNPVSAASPDSWTIKTPMREARGGLGVAVVNGKIYAIGGSAQNGLYPPLLEAEFVGTNEQYDPATDTWTSRKQMPTPRAYFAITVYQNKIYCIGGIVGIHLAPYGGSSVLLPEYTLSGINEVYDPATDTWETRTFMPTPRMWIHGNVADGKIYIMDGFEGRESPNEVYDPATDSWNRKASMPATASHYASTAVDDNIYVVASDIYTSNEEDSKRLLIYDAGANTWSEGTPTPSVLILGSAAATSGVMAPKRVYALGVQSGNDTPVTNVYDPQSDSWRVGSPMHIMRIDFGVAVLDDRLYVIGGYIFNGFPHSGNVTVSAANEQYTPFEYETPAPTIPTPSPEPTPQPFSTALVIGSVIAVVAVVGLGLLVYLKKRHPKTGDRT